MAKNVNVDTMSFDGQALGEPMTYDADADGETLRDVAGIDDYITLNLLVGRFIIVVCTFKDWDNAKTLLTAKWGNEGPLTLVSHQAATTTDKSLSIANARLMRVRINAVKDDPGTHSCIFIARTLDGQTNPVT